MAKMFAEIRGDAVSLYSQLGFIEVGRRRAYYSEPDEDAVLMTKYF